MNVMYLLTTALLISLVAVAATSYIGGFNTVYSIDQGDNTTYLDISSNVSDVANELQDRTSSGNVLETIWNSLSILGSTITIYTSLARSITETIGLPHQTLIITVVSGILTLIVVGAIIAAITKREV
jgi:hypothetical protein